MDWSRHLDAFGIALLERLGESPYYLPTDYNPVTRALREEEDVFMEKYGDMKGFNRIALARVAVVCQMVVYDDCRGPERDGELQSLRRHWYAYFKGMFAQPVARIFGDFTVNEYGVTEYNDLAWTQRLSQVYAGFVNSGTVTYKDLWIEDASRMMESFYNTLFAGCNVVMCVEKDSLMKSFMKAAASLGAKGLYSGKGKPSFAATERMLTDVFGWRGPSGWQNPFSAESPLYVLTLTDHDKDGEDTIAGSFANQARRYTPYVIEARIGIKPHQVVDVGQDASDNAYAVKVTDRGYVRWATRRALFMATCVGCGNQWGVIGCYDDEGDLDPYWVPSQPHTCPVCSNVAAVIEVGPDTPLGYEVEALQMIDYRRLMVDALLSVLPFETIVEKLRDECKADTYNAAETMLTEVCAESEAYQQILKEMAYYDALRQAKEDFEDEVRDYFKQIGDEHDEDWHDEEDDPEIEDYKVHVEVASGYVWRPFDKQVRTDKLEEWLRKEYTDDIQDFVEQKIEVEDTDEEDTD